MLLSPCETHLLSSKKSFTKLGKEFWCEFWKELLFHRGSRLSAVNKLSEFERKRQTHSACPSTARPLHGAFVCACYFIMRLRCEYFFLSWKHKVWLIIFLKCLWLTLLLVPWILSLKSRMFLFKSLLISGANSIYKFFSPFSLLAEAVFKGHLLGNWFCCRWYFPNIMFCSYLTPSNVQTFLPKTFTTLTILRKEVKKNNPRIKNFML